MDIVFRSVTVLIKPIDHKASAGKFWLKAAPVLAAPNQQSGRKASESLAVQGHPTPLSPECALPFDFKTMKWQALATDFDGTIADGRWWMNRPVSR